MGTRRSGAAVRTRVLIAAHGSATPGLRELIEAQGCEVVAQTPDGLEASRLAGLLQPEIAVLDLSMPFLDGLAVGSLIRRVSPSTRLIALGDRPDRHVMEAAVGIGFVAYLVKRLAPGTLAEAIRTVAAGASYHESLAVRTRS